MLCLLRLGSASQEVLRNTGKMEKNPEISLSLNLFTSLHNKYRTGAPALNRSHGWVPRATPKIPCCPCPDLAYLPELPCCRRPAMMMGTTNATQYLHLCGIEI